MPKMTLEGIVAQAIPFKDYDRIVTLFTPSEGLIKLVVKGAIKGRPRIVDPLTRVEVLCTPGRGDLYSCYDTAILDPQLQLRSRLELLQTACEMLQAISATQYPGKPAEELYQLLLAYFLRLPEMAHPATLSSSFRLKTLRFEGLFSPHFYCNRCAAPVQGDSFHMESAIYCQSHAPREALAFSAEERDLLLVLGFGRDFNLLRDLQLDQALTMKIRRLFDSAIQAPWFRG